MSKAEDLFKECVNPPSHAPPPLSLVCVCPIPPNHPSPLFHPPHLPHLFPTSPPRWCEFIALIATTWQEFRDKEEKKAKKLREEAAKAEAERIKAEKKAAAAAKKGGAKAAPVSVENTSP